MDSSPLAGLPRVDRVIAHPSLHEARRRLGPPAITALARIVLEEARAGVRGGGAVPDVEAVALEVARRCEVRLATRASRVINATGVLLHTNLGRAPLGAGVAEALARSAAGYTSIELDMASGKRGHRGVFAETALAELTGAEAALVVNNNAAAVMLMLGCLAAGREVIVSRGELVEIGGGFRVPDVMARSGARLVEVGTTNKTRAADYERALDAAPGAAAILRVHQGNFRQIGFVERPPHPELAELARRRGVLLLEDLGSGALVDLSPHGLVGEPVVRASVAAGSDVVCFSTDKLLGGPQGGALVGRAELISKARRDPLTRALRLGRLPLVALEATLASYLEGDLDAVPVLAAVRRPLEAVTARAEAWKQALEARGVPVQGVPLVGFVGGGSLPEEALASAGIAVDAAQPDALAARLRTGSPKVLARIQDGRLLFDARSVLPDEDADLVDAIVAAWTTL